MKPLLRGLLRQLMPPAARQKFDRQGRRNVRTDTASRHRSSLYAPSGSGKGIVVRCTATTTVHPPLPSILD